MGCLLTTVFQRFWSPNWVEHLRKSIQKCNGKLVHRRRVPRWVKCHNEKLQRPATSIYPHPLRRFLPFEAGHSLEAGCLVPLVSSCFVNLLNFLSLALSKIFYTPVFFVTIDDSRNLLNFSSTEKLNLSCSALDK